MTQPTALQRTREILYRDYAIKQGTEIKGQVMNYDKDIDSEAAVWMLYFIEKYDVPETTVFEYIFYSNSKFYIVEMSCKATAKKKVVNAIWEQYMNSVHISR